MRRSDATRQPPQQPLLAHALASTANAIFITDETGKIVWINDAFSRLSGFSEEDAIGCTLAMLRSGQQSQDFYGQLWETIIAGNVWQGEIVDKRKDGSLYTVDEIITPLFDEQGSITHFIAIQHDITRQKQESERDHQLAYHDVLTGLPNRANFLGMQEHEISQAMHTRKMFAMLFVDLDNFKPVNDTLGHPTGDKLLVAVARRLRAAVRQADIVARFGGDEFAILLTRLPDTEVAAGLARKLLATLSRPFVLQGQKINISASIGIAIYPTDGEDPETLLMNADKAMYQAKCHGGNSYQLYGTMPSQSTNEPSS
jgi:diguanylate cyclase (GGDEF)-like protein/PAS domain S-box-containing protein